VASIIPQAVAATPAAQVKVQEIAVLVFPVTAPLKSWVRLVITLAVVGEIVMLTVEEALLPHPRAPNVPARVSNKENFRHLIPFLPIFLNIRPRNISFAAWRPSGFSFFESPILISGPQHPQLKRPAHREAEGADRIEEIRPLRVVEQVHNLWHDLAIPHVRRQQPRIGSPIRIKTICSRSR
jgi:hypothetical protein